MQLIPTLTFTLVFAGHALYTRFLQSSGCASGTTWLTYLADGDVFIGLSLAMGGAFTVWSFRRFRASRSKGAAVGAAGGSALVAGLAALGCFFTGCCGSPMLFIYAGLLGGSSLVIPKWTIALLTFLSIGAGWQLIRSRECRGGDCC